LQATGFVGDLSDGSVWPAADVAPAQQLQWQRRRSALLSLPILAREEQAGPQSWLPWPPKVRQPLAREEQAGPQSWLPWPPKVRQPLAREEQAGARGHDLTA
jgi:hypothetical protein